MKKLLKVVCLGGGNLVPKTLLAPFKKYPVQLTGITSMLDSGGSSGQLRKDFGVLPAGDISRHLIALSDAPQWKKDLFYAKFGQEKFPGGHVGHRFGTVFLSLTEYVLGDFTKALKIARDFLEVKKHQALPATVEKAQLAARLSNGKVIEGEDEIDVPKKHNPRLKIVKLFLKPKAKVFPPAAKAVREADIITLGPGDFYSSTVPCLLPEGMKAAFRASGAKKLFICSVLTKLGETHDFSIMDFTRELEKYLGCPLDFVIYHRGALNGKRLAEYRRKNPLIDGLVKIDKNLPGGKFIGEDIEARSGELAYNGQKITKIIWQLCKV